MARRRTLTIPYCSSWDGSSTRRDTEITELTINLLRNTSRACSRWQWFARAKGMDIRHGTHLGTLGYLPPDIRDIIFGILLDDLLDHIYALSRKYMAPAVRSSDRQLRYDQYHGKRAREEQDRQGLNYNLCLDYETWATDNPTLFRVRSRGLELRQTSLSLAQEFNDFFLRSCVFVFSCPEKFKSWVSQMSPARQTRLRHIKIVLYTDRYCDDLGKCCHPSGHLTNRWISIIPQIQSTLEDVTILDIELGDVAPFAGFANQSEYPRVVLRRIFYRTMGEAVTEWGPYHTVHYKRAKVLIEVLSKQLRRLAPKAQIQIPNITRCAVEDQLFLQSVLEELE